MPRLSVGYARWERWPSGRRRAPAKGVRVKSPSRVRIPLSPPITSLRSFQIVSKIAKNTEKHRVLSFSDDLIPSFAIPRSCWYICWYQPCSAQKYQQMLTDSLVRSVKRSDHPRKVSDGGGLHLLVAPNGGR